MPNRIPFQFLLVLFILSFIFSCKNSNIGNTQETKNEQQNHIDSLAFFRNTFTKNGDYYRVPWSKLMNIKMEEVYSDSLGMDVSLPIFNDTIKSLDNQLVELEGFYIPVDETGDDKIVILSAFPFAQCFFCGKAGVESIVDVLPSSPLPTLKVDSKLTFRGTLKLNRDNFDYLIYVLEQAELKK